MKQIFFGTLCLTIFACVDRSEVEDEQNRPNITAPTNTDIDPTNANQENSNLCETIFQTHGADPGIRLPCRFEVTFPVTPAFATDAISAATNAIGFGRITTPEGYHYSILIYKGGEWGASLERNEPYISDWRIITRNEVIGYIYESTDLGLHPVIHITVDMSRFLLVFYWDDVEARSPHAVVAQHFLSFFESIELFIKERP